jgi:predicted DNA-binding transcriptional regulator AlpA
MRTQLGRRAREMDAETKLMNIVEVAERLRVSVVTVRWLRQEGRFAPAIKVGRRLVWDVRDVEAWIDAHREDAA